jgi:uncharacterized membrane protein (DUF2068 family)
MTGSPSKSSSGRRSHNHWLVLIAAYKFAQALLFIAIGVGARRLLHKDIGDELYALADHLRFDPESRFVNFILEKATLVHDAQLRRIGFVAFCYAGVGILEGIGLYLERMWGEFLTLAITASFLPWEIFEVYRRVTWPRISLLVINFLVFLYLVKLIMDRARHRSGARRR